MAVARAVSRRAPKRRVAADIEDVFERGPVSQAADRFALGGEFAAAAAAGTVLLTWLPVFLLCVAAERSDAPGTLASFLTDAKMHANFLVAVPIFIVSDRLAGRRLREIVRHFAYDGFIRPRHVSQFSRAVHRARALIAGRGAAIVVFAVAYAMALLTVLSYETNLTAWHLSADGENFSPAGWWHLLISLPVLAALALSWLWRLAVWGWLLACISRIPLRLIPAHPDHAAGLGFVGYSLRALAPVGFAIGAVGAGTVAGSLLHENTSIYASGIFAVTLAGISLVLCCLPLISFLPVLTSEWWRSVLAYDALAVRFAGPFGDRWVSGRVQDRGILQTPDFSAAADLSQVVANVHAIRPIPVDLRSIAFFVVATLLPFSPVVFLIIPPSRLLEGLRSLLL